MDTITTEIADDIRHHPRRFQSSSDLGELRAGARPS
jgi:hypothetical protein